MSLPTPRLRRVHLDFHTSPLIEGVGAKFDKKQWQETLRRAEVDSITLTAKCHHGWSYHDTRVGRRHPHLAFDLLRAQLEASKEIGIATPLYLSAGLDCEMARVHPEWVELNDEGRPVRRLPLRAGYDKMCFHSPYLDYLCAQIEEVVTLFPEGDGIFLDIIGQGPGCSPWAMEYMARHGLDASKEEDRRKAGEAAVMNYYARTTAAARSRQSDLPVFHNTGHIPRGRRDLDAFQSHFELESLPTGGWGYDHFPESASYVAQLGKDYTGMTGKFHTTWGEAGGYKHPNALRYECASMLAFGAGCSIGDHPLPSAELDASAYELIGGAYREVKAKEPWCIGASLAPRIGILSAAAENISAVRENPADTGAVRLLLEEHLPFALLDREMDFAPYDLLIFPDQIRVDDALQRKIEEYLAAGGKILLTGESGLRADGSGFAFDIGAKWEGPSPFEIDYVLPRAGLRPEPIDAPFVHYLRSQRIQATTGLSLGDIYDPWFNRTFEHFSGHQHAPRREERSGYDSGVLHGRVAYLAHPVFTAYRSMGHFTCRRYVAQAIRLLLGEAEQVRTNLPSGARLTVTHQAAEKRWIVHLLFAATLNRGGPVRLDAGTVQSTGRSVEVIEDLLPLRDIRVSLRLDRPVRRVTLEPQGVEIPFQENTGRINFQVAEFTAHQMVVLAEG